MTSVTGWAAVALLALAIGISSLRFLTFDPNVLTEALRPNLLARPLPFYAHTILASFALLIGVWQFLTRTRRGPYHRWAGRAYVTCVAIASTSGFLIAFTTEAGPLAATGFAILAVLWFGATLMGYFKARDRDFLAHRTWMTRSYALACAAITLRLIIPTGLIAGFGFIPTYTFAAWASWIITLGIAEILIVRRRGLPLRVPA